MSHELELGSTEPLYLYSYIIITRVRRSFLEKLKNSSETSNSAKCYLLFSTRLEFEYANFVLYVYIFELFC